MLLVQSMQLGTACIRWTNAPGEPLAHPALFPQVWQLPTASALNRQAQVPGLQRRTHTQVL